MVFYAICVIHHEGTRVRSGGIKKLNIAQGTAKCYVELQDSSPEWCITLQHKNYIVLCMGQGTIAEASWLPLYTMKPFMGHTCSLSGSSLYLVIFSQF